LDVTIISVIVSGCVAVAALLAPLLVNFVSEERKWARERKAVQASRVDQSTMDLIQAVAPLLIGSWSYAQDATGRDWRPMYADLRGKYYAWERALWPHCNNGEREHLKEMRAKLATAKTSDLVNLASEFADEVLTLAHTVSERMQ